MPTELNGEKLRQMTSTQVSLSERNLSIQVYLTSMTFVELVSEFRRASSPNIVCLSVRKKTVNLFDSIVRVFFRLWWCS